MVLTALAFVVFAGLVTLVALAALVVFLVVLVILVDLVDFLVDFSVGINPPFLNVEDWLAEPNCEHDYYE